jgi:hypothetical protein
MGIEVNTQSVQVKSRSRSQGPLFREVPAARRREQWPEGVEYEGSRE